MRENHRITLPNARFTNATNIATHQQLCRRKEIYLKRAFLWLREKKISYFQFCNRTGFLSGTKSKEYKVLFFIISIYVSTTYYTDLYPDPFVLWS